MFEAEKIKLHLKAMLKKLTLIYIFTAQSKSVLSSSTGLKRHVQVKMCLHSTCLH